MKFIRVLFTSVGFAVLVSLPVVGQVTSHEVAILQQEKRWQVTTTLNPEAVVVNFWIPRWTSGAYHLAEYGRFIEELTATNANGESLEVERVSSCHFRILNPTQERMTLRYEAKQISKSALDLTALDVESNRITDAYAYFTPCSLLGFVPELLEQPVKVRFTVPPDWKIATALPTNPKGEYVAGNYYELEDSPFFFSPTQQTYEFEVAGIRHSVTTHGASPVREKAINEACEALARAAYEIMGRLPYRTYHFLVGVVPEGTGSGLEHSESTLILVGSFIGDKDLLRVLAHEFMHAWIGERIKSNRLVKPDYTQPCETSTIWVNEGLNDYFTTHLLLHAGLMTREEFIEHFSNAAAMVSIQSPAIRLLSWADTSRNAARWSQELRSIQLFTMWSYQIGPLWMMALDLEMRRASGGERGVVDLLRCLDQTVIQSSRGFEEGTMFDWVSGVAQADMRDFYRRHIEGSEIPDFKSALEVIGFTRKEGTGRFVPVDNPTAEQQQALDDFFEVRR